MSKFWLADALLMAAKIEEREFMKGNKPKHNVHIIFCLDRESGWTGDSDKWFEVFSEQVALCVNEHPDYHEFVKSCCQNYAPEGWWERAVAMAGQYGGNH